MLNVAKADRQIGENLCQVKGAGQVRSAERPVATVNDVALAVKAVPARWRLALLLPVWRHLRRGEVLALQRRHIDLLHGKFVVEQAWSVPMGGKAVIGPPKTDAGIWTLTIPPNVLPPLEDHLEAVCEARAERLGVWHVDGNVSLAAQLQLGVEQRSSEGRANRSPPARSPTQRAYWAAASGASIADLMRRGGYATPRAALRYQHATEDRDPAIAAALGQLAQDANIQPLVSAAAKASRT